MMCLILSAVVAGVNALPARFDQCQLAQLRLNRFVMDAPGMSKLHSVYAITNVGATACRLSPASLNVWSGQRHRARVIPVRDQRSHQLPASYVLPSVRLKHARVPMQQVVWFSVSALGDTAPTFHRLLWSLKSNSLHAKSVVYSVPYTHFPTHTLWHQGLAIWGMGKQCRSNGRLIKLTQHTIIDFSQVLNCG
jgi:hypothetical protein